MGFDWDPRKNASNRKKHGLSFEEASQLFLSGADFLEIPDELHSTDEERFIAVGPILRGGDRGCFHRTYRRSASDHQRAYGDPQRSRTVPGVYGRRIVMAERELTKADFKRAIKASQRRRLMRGEIESGEDIVALRRFVDLSQAAFSSALGISVHTLRNWEQGRRTPRGPALALLKIAARHPSIVREAASSAA